MSFFPDGGIVLVDYDLSGIHFLPNDLTLFFHAFMGECSGATENHPFEDLPPAIVGRNTVKLVQFDTPIIGYALIGHVSPGLE